MVSDLPFRKFVILENSFSPTGTGLPHSQNRRCPCKLNGDVHPIWHVQSVLITRIIGAFIFTVKAKQTFQASVHWLQTSFKDLGHWIEALQTPLYEGATSNVIKEHTKRSHHNMDLVLPLTLKKAACLCKFCLLVILLTSCFIPVKNINLWDPGAVIKVSPTSVFLPTLQIHLKAKIVLFK